MLGALRSHSQNISGKIDQQASSTEVLNTGHVIQLGDGIARVFGLKNVMSSELLTFENGATGGHGHERRWVVRHIAHDGAHGDGVSGVEQRASSRGTV